MSWKDSWRILITNLERIFCGYNMQMWNVKSHIICTCYMYFIFVYSSISIILNLHVQFRQKKTYMCNFIAMSS